MVQTIKVISRQSKLAVAQTQLVCQALQQQGHEVEHITAVSMGDKAGFEPGSADHRKDRFTKTIEDYVLDGRADIAVHSLKDMPVDQTHVRGAGQQFVDSKHGSDLIIQAFCQLEDRRDILITQAPIKSVQGDFAQQLQGIKAQLPSQPTIGTASSRRTMQGKFHWPEANFVSLRGNIHRRIEALFQGDYDAIMLARAGLLRMESEMQYLNDHIIILPSPQWLPAPSQGILAVQCRKNDSDILDSLQLLNDPLAERTALIERAYCHWIGADCYDPVAACYQEKPYGANGLEASLDVCVSKGNLPVYQHYAWQQNIKDIFQDTQLVDQLKAFSEKTIR